MNKFNELFLNCQFILFCLLIEVNPIISRHMQVEINDKHFDLDLHGFSGTSINKDNTGTAFKLSDQLRKKLKALGLKNKGKNIWVYGPEETVFAGVELTEIHSPDTGLEYKKISLERYAYFKHIGPYTLIKPTGQHMRDELNRRGFEMMLPYIEIYGHWNSDESKLETELFMSLI